MSGYTYSLTTYCLNREPICENVMLSVVEMHIIKHTNKVVHELTAEGKTTVAQQLSGHIVKYAKNGEFWALLALANRAGVMLTRKWVA